VQVAKFTGFKVSKPAVGHRHAIANLPEAQIKRLLIGMLQWKAAARPHHPVHGA
jgi:hypothetical protein